MMWLGNVSGRCFAISLHGTSMVSAGRAAARSFVTVTVILSAACARDETSAPSDAKTKSEVRRVRFMGGRKSVGQMLYEIRHKICRQRAARRTHEDFVIQWTPRHCSGSAASKNPSAQ